MDTLEAQQTLTDLENALNEADRPFEVAAELLNKIVTTVKSCRRALAVGDLKALRRSLASIPDQAERIQECCHAMEGAWPYSDQDEERYFASDFKGQLFERAQQAGLSITDQEGTLACYPSLLKISPRERGVSIDRKLSREIRPSRLVEKLVANQKKSIKLTRDFLPALHKTYEELTGKKQGEVARLLDIYDRWTRRPGSKKDYSLQEFTNEIYELDKSARAPEDPPFRLHAGATASKNRSTLLVMSTREGLERTYYAIEFL